MQFSSLIVTYLAILCCYVTLSSASTFELVGDGVCSSVATRNSHDYTFKYGTASTQACSDLCQTEQTVGLRGFSYSYSTTRGASGDGLGLCVCHYEDALSPGEGLSPAGTCPQGSSFDYCNAERAGSGPIDSSATVGAFFTCYRYPTYVGGGGDPHFRTWKNEHFEFHGQCDIVMTKVKNFAKQAGIDLDIHIRTKMVRYWSYIKAVAIQIGNDILEVEGSGAKKVGVDKRHYRINYEYRGPLDKLGGFPVTISPHNDKYTIDLSSKFPGQKIEIKTFKEFVSVKIINPTAESFGNAVGITGDYKTGKTLARDGSTELHDFNELGLEWQVLPSDGKLFHEMSKPQFPELCYLPEDPRGDRARRLTESNITEEAAEDACAGLSDAMDRKGCVYDILATQDLDMVGAY